MREQTSPKKSYLLSDIELLIRGAQKIRHHPYKTQTIRHHPYKTQTIRHHPYKGIHSLLTTGKIPSTPPCFSIAIDPLSVTYHPGRQCLRRKNRDQLMFILMSERSLCFRSERYVIHQPGAADAAVVVTYFRRVFLLSTIVHLVYVLSFDISICQKCRYIVSGVLLLFTSWHVRDVFY